MRSKVKMKVECLYHFYITFPGKSYPIQIQSDIYRGRRVEINVKPRWSSLVLRDGIRLVLCPFLSVKVEIKPNDSSAGEKVVQHF